MALRQPVRSRSKAARTVAAKASGGRDIPDKLYFRIGEVAKLCEVAPYVLRFWESEFPQLKPNKGGTGQRLYRRRDVEMALRVKTLLYDEGYTIAGARQFLKGELRSSEPQAIAINAPTSPAAQHTSSAAESTSSTAEAQMIAKLRQELLALRTMLAQSPVATMEVPKPRVAAVQSIRAAKPKAVPARPDIASLFGDLD